MHVITNPTDELKAAVSTAVSALSEDLDALTPDDTDARESVVNTVRSAETTAADLKALAKQLTAAAADYEALSSLLKTDIVEDMAAAGTKTETVGIFKLTRCKSPATVDVDIAPEDLPEDYRVVKVSADKRKLTRAVKDGVSIDGVTLRQGEHLRIGIAPTK